jgi:hypothetical protein
MTSSGGQESQGARHLYYNRGGRMLEGNSATLKFTYFGGFEQKKFEHGSILGSSPGLSLGLNFYQCLSSFSTLQTT